MYWSRHPLGGDEPIEATFLLLEELKVFSYFVDMVESGLDEARDLFVVMFENALFDEFLLNKALSNRMVRKYCFVLPFVVIEFGIKIPDEKLSQRLKLYITDGGAEFRGYTPKDSNSLNNYNGFASPYDYASMLSDNWEKIMRDDSIDNFKEIKSWQIDFE